MILPDVSFSAGAYAEKSKPDVLVYMRAQTAGALPGLTESDPVTITACDPKRRHVAQTPAARRPNHQARFPNRVERWSKRNRTVDSWKAVGARFRTYERQTYAKRVQGTLAAKSFGNIEDIYRSHLDICNGYPQGRKREFRRALTSLSRLGAKDRLCFGRGIEQPRTRIIFRSVSLEGQEQTEREPGSDCSGVSFQELC